ncbi:hypothetical protein IFM89_024992 [Coptis chinensis]|uniref:Aminotransferase-like plant mobile domain-containing protein n=1 Tax=Coptis chinensis TaxID=261450 RepID=A0A835LX18_9MAGN|nr:hypothetical protein IFM89_024992 [Coptis chinensis]
MTITLDDVSQLLGVMIRGKVVTGDTDLSLEQTKKLLHRGLGIPMDKIDAEMKANKFTSRVRMNFLLKQFVGKVTDQDLHDGNGVVVKKASTQKELQFAVRVYLLFFFGCTAFTDITGTAIPVCYLRLLLKFNEIRDYTWGAALLAYLYRSFGTATSAKVKGVLGYLTLLHAWIYEYFPRFRPFPNLNYNLSMSCTHKHSVTQLSYTNTTEALNYTRAIHTL